MKIYKFDADLDTLENPKYCRAGSVLFFIFSLVAIFACNEWMLSMFPESGKIISHWDFFGTPDAWADAGKEKIFSRYFHIAMFVGILILLIPIFIFFAHPEYFGDIEGMNKPYRGNLIYKFPKLKAAKIWAIKNFSALDSISFILLFADSIFSLIMLEFLRANETENGKFSTTAVFLPIFLLTLLLVVYFALWEISPKKLNKLSGGKKLGAD